MGNLSQTSAPVYEALERFRKKRVVPFDVPGHKRGRGNPELRELLGEKCVNLDVNSMKPLDNLCHPVSVIRDAEELAAEAFAAAHAFFMVGGTTSSVQSMVLSSCKAGDKIILPRNVHKSVINALVLNGAIPVYINPQVDSKLGISLGMEIGEVAKAIKVNPDATAVLVNNPTYYGICSDLRSIVKLAHEHNMLCLVDEAHGTHFYFGKNMPVNAMAAGADMASVSMHKSGGSLTQSSLLLTGPNVNWEYVSQIINLTQTTSASYLLLSSLDISRRNLYMRGEASFGKVQEMAEYAREEINSIGGFYAYGRELKNGSSIYDFDVTKLSVLQVSRFMICCATNMISRLSSAISPIFLLIFLSVTVFRILNVLLVRWQISSACIPRIRRRCSIPNISRLRLLFRRRRLFMPRMNLCLYAKLRDASAVSL